MNYKLETTVPNSHFKYLIRIGRMLEFDTVRRWLSQTYGLAEQIDRDTINNPHWGFEVRLGGSTVYLRGEEELNWFKIKYGNPI
jgi:hypothetical protein